jgi:TolB protein
MKKVVLILCFFVTHLCVLEASKIYVNIGSPGFKKPIVAVNIADGNLDKIVKSDLIISDVFELLSQDLYPKDPFNANMSEWSVTGAEYLLQVNLDNASVIIKLYSVKDGSELLYRSFSPFVNQEDTAHEISSSIYERLTGSKGIFKTKIIAVCKDKNGFKNLFMMDYDGRRLKPITNHKTLCLSPAISPDAVNVAYTVYASKRIRGQGNIMVQELRIHNIRTGKETVVVGGTGQSSGVTWSSDGKKLAFTYSGNGDPDIYLYDVDTKKMSPLVTNRGLDVEPSFSPDGKFIVFSSSKSGNPELYKMDLETKEQTRLTFNRHYNSSPEWSPDGGSIVFAGLDNPFGKRSYFDIFLIDPSATKIERFTIDNGNNEDPSWSGEGRHFVFSSTRNKGSDLYIMNKEGTKQTKITSGIFCYSPDWSKK